MKSTKPSAILANRRRVLSGVMSLPFGAGLVACSGGGGTATPPAPPPASPPPPPPPAQTRPFRMGFTTWPYEATVAAVDDVYAFLDRNGDAYLEHIDVNVPWAEALSGAAFPTTYMNELSSRVSRRIPGKTLTLSLSPLNGVRDDIAPPSEGALPTSLQGQSIDHPDYITAWTNYCRRLVMELNPDRLIFGIEVNEYRKNTPSEWDAFVRFTDGVRSALEVMIPAVPLSQSITLHSFFDALGQDTAYRNDVIALMNDHDFASFSYYPFLHMARSESEIGQALDLISTLTDKPVVFAETGQPAEDISVPNLGFSFPATPADQDLYLERLFAYALTANVELITWWQHRDFDAIFNTFPPGFAQDIGRLFRDTGLLNEAGVERPAFGRWDTTRARSRV